MSWIDKNWKPLTVVGGLLGLSWFAGKRFERAETFEANEICYRSCYEHEWRLSGTPHLGDYTPNGTPILNWRCDACGQSKSSPTEPSSKGDTHDWRLTKTKNWEDGVFTVYAQCERCGVKGYTDGDVEESIDSVHPSLRAETFEAKDNSWCVNHGWIHTARAGDIIPCTSCNDMICEGCRCGGCGNCQTSDCCECKNAETFEAEKIIKGKNFHNLYSLSVKYHPEDSPYGDFYYFRGTDIQTRDKLKELFWRKSGHPNKKSAKFDEKFDELLDAWIAIYPNLDNAEVITVGIEPDSKVNLSRVEDWLDFILDDNQQYGAVLYPKTTIPENLPYSTHGYFPQFTIRNRPQKQDNRHDYFYNHEIELDFIDPLPSAKSNEVEADITLTMENGDLWKAFPVKFTRSGNRLGAETKRKE